MILADFSSQQQTRNHNELKKQTKNHTKNASSINQSRNNETHHQPYAQQKTVYSYMNELGIGNVEEFYAQEQQERRKELLKKQKQANHKLFEHSIQRLYSTGLGQRMKDLEESDNPADGREDGQQAEREENTPEHFYNEIYSQEEGFDRKFRLRMLETECHKMKDKLFSRFTGKYDIWVAENQQDQKIKSSLQATFKPTHPHFKSKIMLQPIVTQYFIRSVLAFIFSQNPSNKSSQPSTHQRFFALYSDFVNKFKLAQWESPIENRQFDQKTYKELRGLVRKLPFLYWLVNFVKLENFEEVKFKNLKDVERWVSDIYQKERDWQLIYKVFEDSLNPKFTVPYETKLYQVKKIVLKKTQTQEQDKITHKIKANPIPSSTYTKPSRPQSQKKTSTKPAPFNFTQTHSKIPKVTADQIYSWNRNFKAKPVPKTVYQPQLMGENEREKEWAKKTHIEKLYKEAKYPETMGYLENYGEVQERRKKELEEKHKKDKTQERVKPKPVPDFQKIHQQQRRILEQNKQMNRPNTQPKPFNFTETKRSDMKNTLKATMMLDHQLYESSRKQKKKPISQDTNMPEAKSTAKFDAYVSMRKEEREEKKAEIKERQEMKKRKQNDMKVYKEILKQRMHNELVNQPKAMQYNTTGGGNNENIVKVNLEEIYLGRPLLMQGTKNDNRGKRQDDLQTCFTDGFEPII